MTTFRRGEGGQTIVLIAAVIAVLLLAVGLAIDAGQLYANRRAAQIAADSAAWAGAVVLFNGGNASQATSAANADAAKNGYSSGITVNSPPASGPTTCDPFFVEVLISQSVTPTFFTGARTLSVRAVAGATRSGTGDGMLVTRSTNTSGTLSLSNTTTLSVTGSGIQVDSTSTTAISISSSASINSPVSSYNRVVGDASSADKLRITPALATGQLSVADPFVNLPGPPINCLSSFGAQDIQNTTTTLSPGIYTAGIRIRGSSVVTLNPGVYVLQGGGAAYGFTTQNTASVQVASGSGGVLLFNTYSNYPNAPGGSPTCGAIDLNSSGSVTLRAQTVGSYAGMVIYQDRNCTSTVLLENSGSRPISGTIYVPNATVSNIGATTLNMTAQLVVLQYSASTSGSNLNLTFDPSKVAGGRVPALIE